MKDVSLEKKAITYSYLAHISNSGILSRGPMDIFIPIVKKGLQLIDKQKLEKRGENITEIRDVLEKEYEIDIPIPTLRNILKRISLDINTDEKIYFTLNSDDSFWLKEYYFEEFDEQLVNAESDIANLQKLFAEFCLINNIEGAEDKCIIRYIENNRILLSRLLSNTISKEEINKENFVIPAKFIKFFKENGKAIYEQIKNLYLGSVITSYLDMEEVKLEKDITLLLDTNFIISLLDLNTKESTRTCKKLVEICLKQKYNCWVLPQTIEETQQLLIQRANTLDSALINRYINEQDIYHAAQRRGLSKVDLIRISDNLESTLESFKINVVGNTQKLENIAKRSREYENLKQIRNTRKAALHDAMAIHYVREKRGRDIKRIELVNSWFVNNSFSSDNKEDEEQLIALNGRESQSELIKVDDLLNLLWLSSPDVKKNISLSEFSDIGLTSLVAFTLNESLPKSWIIKELDDNIQKYCNEEEVTGKNMHDLALSIANHQTANIEELNLLAVKDKKVFVERIKVEAKKYNDYEKQLNENLNHFIANLSQEQNNLKAKQKGLEARQNELEEENKKREKEFNKEKERIGEENEKLVINIKEEKETARKNTARLIKNIKDIDDKISTSEIELSQMNEKRSSSINMFKFWFVVFLEICSVLILLGGISYLLIDFIYSECSIHLYLKRKLLLTISIPLAFVSIIWRIKELYILSPRIKQSEIRELQYKYWDENNPQYNTAKNKLLKLKDEKEELLKL